MFGKFTGRSRGSDSAPRGTGRVAAPLSRIASYWQDLAERESDIPERGDVDPRALRDVLEYAFLAQEIAPGLAKLRVAGAHLCDLMGEETGGLPMQRLMRGSADATLERALIHVFSGAGAARLCLRSGGGLTGTTLAGEMLILPLRGEDGRITRALGGLVSDGRIGRTPRRFDITETTLTPLAIPVRPVAPMLREAQAVGAAATRVEMAPKRGAHLRLVVSND